MRVPGSTSSSRSGHSVGNSPAWLLQSSIGSSPEQLDKMLGSLPAARIGLVPADRPADVLPLIGWQGAVNGFATPLPIAAVLRSWEDRFGARLLEVGFDVIRLLADRPPRTVEHAQRVAAEHLVVSDQCAVFDITARLMETPMWEFWWD